MSKITVEADDLRAVLNHSLTSAAAADAEQRLREALPPELPDWHTDENVIVVQQGNIRYQRCGGGWRSQGGTHYTWQELTTLSTEVTPYAWRTPPADPDTITLSRKEILSGVDAKTVAGQLRFDIDQGYRVTEMVLNAVADALEARADQ